MTEAEPVFSGEGLQYRVSKPLFTPEEYAESSVGREVVPESLDPALSGELVGVPGDANLPRLFSAPHPSAVDSLGPVAVEWIEDRLGSELRWSQKMVLLRALEVDSSGEFCWSDVVVLQPRRGGKTVILRELVLWRASHPELFGESQNVLHLAKDLRLARQTMSPLWQEWCPESGLKVLRSNGSEAIEWGDGSAWRLMPHGGAYGHEAGLIVVDEGWAMTQRRIEEAVEPTLMDRRMPQIWFFSMAHSLSTDLVSSRRRMAMDPVNNVMLAEWSADPGIDLDDVGEWLAVPPHRSDAIVRDYRKGFRRRPKGFREQLLNVWAPIASSGVREWPVGWGAASGVGSDVPPPGGVGALESSFDKRGFSVVVVVRDVVSGVVSVWSRRLGSQDDAVALLEEWAPGLVFVGVSLVARVSLSMEVVGAGGRETAAATAVVADLVRRGLVVHDHDVGLVDQTLVARIAHHESGLTLSAKQSVGAVDSVRALLWAVHGCLVPVVDEPMVWA